MRKPIDQPNAENFKGLDTTAIRWLESVHNTVVDIRLTTVTFNPASVAANTTVEQTVTLAGLKTDDIILAIKKPTTTAGLGILGGRVSATDTLAIEFINASTSAKDAGSETYTVIYIKNSRI